MDEYIVRVRFFGEERDIREFIQPWSAPVVEVTKSLPAGEEEAVLWSWEFASRHIRYPLVEPYDYRYQEAFLQQAGRPKAFSRGGPVFREVRTDYWQMPAETLALGWGDCEDSAAVVVSILRNRLPPERIVQTVGTWKGFGHAWPTYIQNGRRWVLETTRSPAIGLQVEALPYVPYLEFNDVFFHEFRPGLLDRDGPRLLVRLDRLQRSGAWTEKMRLMTAS